MKNLSLKELCAAMSLTETEKGISYNFDNQHVEVIGRNGRPSIRNYTVYRVAFEDGELYGSVRRYKEWNRYRYDVSKRRWVPVSFPKD